MFGNLLSLNDRVEPGGANDEDEVIKLASALDEVEGRRPVHREIGSFDQNTVIERTRKFQRARGLQADGLVNPNGPTAQRIAAEQFRRRSALPHRVVLGRGANLPLWASVGEGGVNLPDDTRAMTNALRLTGHWPVAGIPMTRAGHSGTVEAICSFQRHHGLRPDGLAEPFGPTHDMLDDVLGPRLAKLVGEDPTRPATFEPAEPQIVARNVPFRSTTIRTRFQDEADLDSEDDYRAAVDLGRSIAEDVAAAGQSVPLVGEVSTVDLAGMTGDDQFEDDGVSENAPVFHDNSGSPVERAKSMLETRRFAALKAQPELQERVTSSAREELTGKPDRAVEAKLAALMRQARQVRDPNSPHPKGDPYQGLLYPRLVVAHMEILAERYRDRHPDLTDDEINRMVLAKAALGMGLSNEQAEHLLTFAPYTGPAFAVLDGIDLVMNVADMVETGEFEWGTIAMAAATFVPGVPRGVGRTGKDAAKKGDHKSSAGAPATLRALPDEQIREIYSNKDAATGKLVDWRETNMDLVLSFGGRKSFGPEYWDKIPYNVQRSLNASLPHLIRRKTEAWAYLIEKAAEQIGDMPLGILKRVKIVGENGEVSTRHFDAFIIGRPRRNPVTNKPEIIDTDKTFPSETKGARGAKSTAQKILDGALLDGAQFFLFPSKNGEKFYPLKIERKVIDFQIPLSDVPEGEFLADLNKMLVRKGVKDEMIQPMVANFQHALQVQRALIADGRSDLAGKISLGMALGVLVLSQENGDQEM